MCSIHLNINEIICPFSPQSQIKAQHCLLFSTIMYQYHTCSTDSVTDHDNPAVKCIVIHTILKYNLLTYKTYYNHYKKTISWDIFESKNIKICPSNVTMKNRIPSVSGGGEGGVDSQ